jgi:hypothetical protein
MNGALSGTITITITGRFQTCFYPSRSGVDSEMNVEEVMDD